MPKISALRRILILKRIVSAKPVLPAIIVFLAAFVIRVQNISFRSIWMDEDAQAAVAKEAPIDQIVFEAARHHQPPIDYYLEKAGLALFGYTEVGARIHAVVWSALAATLFFLLLLKEVRHPLAILMGLAIYLFHPELIRYAVEGRPISAGICFAGLYLYITRIYFSSPPKPGHSLKWLGLLFAGAVGLLLSVGFQPLVLIVTTGIAVLPAALQRSRRRDLARYFGATLIGFAVSLPVLLLGVENGDAYLGSAPPLERLWSMTSAFLLFDIFSYKEKLGPLIGHLMPLLAGALPLAALHWRRHFRWTNRRRADVGLLLVLLFYPVVFDTLFHGLIHYRVALRYFLTLAPFALFAAVRLLDDALLGLGRLPRRRAARQLGSGLIAVLIALSMTHAIDGIRDRNATSIRTDWRSLFAYLNTSVPRGSDAYLFSLVPVDRWSPPRFYAQRFYYPKVSRHPAALHRETRLLPDYRQAEKRWPADVLIVTPYGFSSIHRGLLTELPYVSVLRFDRLSVIHINHGDDMRKRVRRVFERLAKRLSKTENHYRVFQALCWMRLNDKDDKGALHMLKTLKRIDLEDKLGESVISPLEAAIYTEH